MFEMKRIFWEIRARYRRVRRHCRGCRRRRRRRRRYGKRLRAFERASKHHRM